MNAASLRANHETPQGTLKSVLDHPYPGVHIVAISPKDKGKWAWVSAALQVMDADLGYVGDFVGSDREIVYAYLKDRRVVACATVLAIDEAYRVVLPAADSGLDTSGELEPDSAGAAELVPSSPKRPRVLYRSHIPEPASCGVSRMWVLAKHRRQGLATRLLDVIRLNYMPDQILPREELAFSQPTPSGHSFAERYTGRPDFLVFC